MWPSSQHSLCTGVDTSRDTWASLHFSFPSRWPSLFPLNHCRQHPQAPGHSPDSSPGGIQPSQLPQIRGARSQATTELLFWCIRSSKGFVASPGTLPSIMPLLAEEIISQFKKKKQQQLSKKSLEHDAIENCTINSLKGIFLPLPKLASRFSFISFYTLNAIMKRIWAAILWFIKLAHALDLICSLNQPWETSRKVVWASLFQMRKLKPRMFTSG